MCGIAGWTRPNKNQLIKPENVTNMLTSLENRGRDASGIAWVDDATHKLWVLKTHAKSSDFVTLKAYQEALPAICDSKIVLIHTRLATNGSPLNNCNNHPIHNKNGVIIHNGVIRVPEDIKGDGFTDTEQIMLYVQKYGWKEGLTKVNGSMSIAYYQLHGGKLFVYSEGSPMVYHSNHNMFCFASTKEILRDGFPEISEKSIRDVAKQFVFLVKDNWYLQTVAKIKRSYTVYATSSSVTNGTQGILQGTQGRINYYDCPYEGL